MRAISLSFIITILMCSCGGEKEKKTPPESNSKAVIVPRFNSDSAYSFVDKQVKFGPRVPNAPAHRATGDYLISQLQKFGAVVKVQEFDATTFDKQHIKLRNIIATYNPSVQKRILLAAHWDTRPFADKDVAKKNAPFDGANDGASGVGVLLEIARQLGKTPPTAGIDIVLFDGEDWGERDDEPKVPLPEELEDWWCLGSQYWAKNKGNYSAYYGIVLDMVGAKGSRFFREGTSLEYAPKIVENVWNVAEKLGYSGYFVKQNQDGIDDDHLHVNRIAKIPMIDIVHYQPGLGYFGDYHHKTKDNMSIIDKQILGVVGDVVMHTIYLEE